MESWNPTVLILGSGGVKGYMMIGSLLLLEKTTVLEKVKTVVGISIGSLIGLLFVIGCTATEILELSLTMNISDMVSGFDLQVIHQYNGIFPHQLFRSKIEEKLKQKFGFLPTFSQLYLMTGYQFICVVTNLDDDQTEYFSHETEPDLLVSEGVIMSMNIPFLFHMYKYKNKLYADGAIINPFPIEKFDNQKTDILTIYLGETYINPQTSLLNYLLKIIKLVSEKEKQKMMLNQSDRCKIIDLLDDSREPLGLKLSFEKKTHMILKGYMTTYQFIDKLPNYKLDIQKLIPVNFFSLNGDQLSIPKRVLSILPQHMDDATQENDDLSCDSSSDSSSEPSSIDDEEEADRYLNELFSDIEILETSE
jgi:predicted acylesterase/phospholipase RssA